MPYNSLKNDSQHSQNESMIKCIQNPNSSSIVMREYIGTVKTSDGISYVLSRSLNGAEVMLEIEGYIYKLDLHNFVNGCFELHQQSKKKSLPTEELK